MLVDPIAATSARVIASDSRDKAHAEAAAYAAKQSGLAHDQRIQEAKSSDSPRPTVAKKRADRKTVQHSAPPSGRTRPASGSKILDILA